MLNPRYLRSLQPSLRRLHTTPLVLRDLGAKYRRPPLPPASAAPVLAATPPPPPKPAGPRDKVVEVEGVRIPPKPIVPGDEDCCMSGCVHCVLTIYADDLEEYNAAMAQAKARLEVKKVPRGKWPHVMDEADETEEDAPKMDPTLSAFAALEAKLAAKPAPPPPKATPRKPTMDAGMAAFMALEAKLKEKREYDSV